MILSKKFKITYLAMVYFIALVYPFLALINCSKWNFLNFTNHICLINFEFIRATEKIVKGFLYINAFNLYIPLIVYILLVVFFAQLSSRLFNGHNLTS